MTGSRAVLWRLFAVLAALLLPLAVSSAWLATVVTDSDAYVDTVAPLADDEDVQDAVARTVEGATVAAVQEATGQSLDGARRDQVAAAVGLAIESAEFETIWREANRTAHRQALRILDGDAGRVDAGGRVVVEVGPVYDSVIRSLEQRGLLDAAAVPSVQASIPLVKSSDLDRARTAYELLDAAGLWVPALWLVLVALTLLVAGERRRAAVWLAVGSILGLLVLALGLVVARGVLISELGSSTDDDLVRSIWDVLVSPLYWTVGVGLAVSVVVLVLMAVLGRRRSSV